jgi:endoglucanase
MKNVAHFTRSRAFRRARDLSFAVVAVLAACDASKPLLPSVTTDVGEFVNRLTGLKFFINPAAPARRQADEWRASRPADAALMDRMAAQPVANWMGDWNADIRRDVANIVSNAASQGSTPVFVAYNIPYRDCGSYSAGGSATASSYRQWIRDFAAGLAGGIAVVVLEPDALPDADCLPAAGRDERYALLKDAVQVLKDASALVYLDAGHARWLGPDAIAARLEKAGISGADGFSLNVSNYVSTADNIAYGESVSARVGGKHFIIDTSRNGMGGNGSEWCNVPGQSLGREPTTDTGNKLVDAYLWVKVPGESDGTCNGGPSAGSWWPEYALALARSAQTLASR